MLRYPILELADGKVIVVASVPARVKELLAVSVLPSAIVSVDPVAGAVSATLFTEVAVATPNTGVTKVGLLDKTTFVDPVDDVTPVPPLATGRVPVTFVVKFVNVVEDVPVPPLAIGNTPLTPDANAMVPLN